MVTHPLRKWLRSQSPRQRRQNRQHIQQSFSAELADLNGRNLYTGVPASANSNTIFDRNSLSLQSLVVNPGTGIRRVKITELQHMFGTGRT